MTLFSIDATLCHSYLFACSLCSSTMLSPSRAVSFSFYRFALPSHRRMLSYYTLVIVRRQVRCSPYVLVRGRIKMH